jgi:hypothetical protein
MEGGILEGDYMKRQYVLGLTAFSIAAASLYYVVQKPLPVEAAATAKTSEQHKEPAQQTSQTTESQATEHPAAVDEAASSAKEKSPQQIMLDIKSAADSNSFSFSFLSAILNMKLPKEVKFMALQAFSDTNHTDRTEIYQNTEALIEFINSVGPTMDDKEHSVISELLERMNDHTNPKKSQVDNFLIKNFEEYRTVDKEKAKVFLNAIDDQSLVKSVMDSDPDRGLREAAQNRLPHIAQPNMVKEIVDDERFTVDQKSAAVGHLALAVDGEMRGNMTDADALIIWAKSLDKKHGTGNQFYKETLQGIALSRHKDKDRFLTEMMKSGLAPYKNILLTSGKVPKYSSVPEVSAMFGYLSRLPEDSLAYSYFEGEFDRILSTGACPRFQSDIILADLVSFWLYSCEMSNDCGTRSKTHNAYQSVSKKYDRLKKTCPSIP